MILSKVVLFNNKLVDVSTLAKSSRINIEVQCDFCNNIKCIPLKTFNEYTKNDEQKFACSLKCVALKKKENYLKKGIKHHMQLSSVKDKIKSTNIKRHGVEFALQSKKSIEKFKKTNLEKYGVEHPMQNKEILDKLRNSVFEKHGVYWNSTLRKKPKIKKSKSEYKRYIDFIQNKTNYFDKFNCTFIQYQNNYIEFCCNNCKCDQRLSLTTINRDILADINPCHNCGERSKIKSTVPHNKVKQILIDNNIEFIENHKILNTNFEIDLYIPKLNIGLEINGLYWHSEYFKEKYYHINKTNLAKENSITLIHLWEDDITYKFNIVKSLILNKLNITPNKIYARQCKIKEVSYKDTKEFLNNNHIQGFCNSKTRLGLYFNDKLVSLITFGKSRNTKNKIELLRFCNIINTNVLGAFSKLLKYFINNYNPKEIITYASLDHSIGNVYLTNGFKFIGKTTPNYFWYKINIRENRFKYRKSELIKMGYDAKKTEMQIMHELGYNRVYDCGNLIFQYIY